MSAASAIALLLDLDGAIEQIVFNSLVESPRVGASVRDLFEPSAQEKVAGLLAETRQRGIAVDWELPLCTHEGPKLVRVSATRLGDAVFLTGNGGASDVYDLYDELMRINNEQSSSLRAALKQIARRRRDPPESAAIYDEMTKLTNELGALQRSLAKQNVELERINRRKDQILGTVAHDLRNPLGSITGFSGLLLHLAGDDFDERSRTMLERIQNASEYMLSLVEDLLDFSAIESGEIRLDRTRVSLPALLGEIVELNRPFSTQKRIDLTLEAADVTVKIDANKIQQVVTNLISNAVKYSHESTTVHVEAFERGSSVQVRVSDQGQGIPAGELGKLFQPFTTTSVRATAGERSTGLGLAIARKVVEAHGGDIGVESEVGKGSCFWFDLPLDTARNQD